jgi:hypothetical protein
MRMQVLFRYLQNTPVAAPENVALFLLAAVCT